MTFILGVLFGSLLTIGISFVVAADDDDDDYSYRNSGNQGSKH